MIRVLESRRLTCVLLGALAAGALYIHSLFT